MQKPLKTDELEDNELATAKENEEDFDAFNADTFADGKDFDGAEDWEQEHDKLIALEGDDPDADELGGGDRTLENDEYVDDAENGFDANNFEFFSDSHNSGKDVVNKNGKATLFTSNSALQQSKQPQQANGSELKQYQPLQLQQHQQQSVLNSQSMNVTKTKIKGYTGLDEMLLLSNNKISAHLSRGQHI